MDDALVAPVREATDPDGPALSALQSELRSPSPELLGAALDGVGTVLVTPRPDDRPAGYLLSVPGDGETYIAELAVAPDCRREGRASALLAEAIERWGRLRLTVAPENEGARRCYESLGFEVVGRDPDAYDGAPGLVMVR